MYNDKIIKIGKKPFEISDVMYTGGNIYVYFGKFENGTYFIFGDCEEAATIIDADPTAPSEEFDYRGFDPNWIEEHYVGCSDMQFIVTVLRQCAKEKYLSQNEITDRISDQLASIKYDKIKTQIRQLIKTFKKEYGKSGKPLSDDDILLIAMKAYGLGIQNRDNTVN